MVRHDPCGQCAGKLYDYLEQAQLLVRGLIPGYGIFWIFSEVRGGGHSVQRVRLEDDALREAKVRDLDVRALFQSLDAVQKSVSLRRVER